MTPNIQNQSSNRKLLTSNPSCECEKASKNIWIQGTITIYINTSKRIIVSKQKIIKITIIADAHISKLETITGLLNCAIYDCHNLTYDIIVNSCIQLPEFCICTYVFIPKWWYALSYYFIRKRNSTSTSQVAPVWISSQVLVFRIFYSVVWQSKK